MDLVSKTTTLPLVALETLRRQHHSLYPVYKLTLPDPEVWARQDIQEWLVGKVLHDPALEGNGPEEGYERRFWRRIVQVLEEGVEVLQRRGDQDAEVDTRIYEHLTRLMVSDSPERADDLPGQSYRTFIYDTQNDIEQRVTLLEEQMAIQGGTTGLRTWTASLHLGHYILSQPQAIFAPSASYHSQNTSRSLLPPILELGAGTGFLSVLLAQLGAEVMSTDLGDTSTEYCRLTPLTRLRFNIKLNGLEGRIRVSHLDWMDSLRPESERPDIWQEAKGRTVVAADVIYDPTLVPALVNTIKALIVKASGQAIIAATVRNEDTLRLFEQLCEQEHMIVQRLRLDPVDPTRPTFWDSGMDERTEVRIMRVTQRENG